ncbi:gamma-interferon-inducible lysosomal thiol reductase-like [Periplaneta americana]|uniref:gamma-interferon-inducible lysosomal thiol reductase-like n=1 Tax=Periplaneta americana TaxID=6978 RepID=UPI0037E8ABBC
MDVKTLITVAALLAVAASLTFAEVEAVNMTLFYESLCGYSRRFILDQVYPTWKKLSNKYLGIDFVPCGGTEYYDEGEGHFSFTCVRGRDECHANVMQACVAHLFRDDQEFVVKFVACIMETAHPDRAGPQCAESLGTDFEKIQQCMIGNEGEQLMVTACNRHKSANPPITVVPWMLFNGEHDNHDHRNSLDNLTSVVCGKIKQDKPDVCSHF